MGAVDGGDHRGRGDDRGGDPLDRTVEPDLLAALVGEGESGGPRLHLLPWLAGGAGAEGTGPGQGGRAGA
ncbi:hypothetical protein [Streptomyces albidoflavus]|uniref:hypothetical protein n=2 Tax=Streptomyces TaxID=1883 RepID=UPI003D14F8DC